MLNTFKDLGTKSSPDLSTVPLLLTVPHFYQMPRITLHHGNVQLFWTNAENIAVNVRAKCKCGARDTPMLMQLNAI